MFVLVYSEAQPDLPNQQEFFVVPLNQTVPGYKAIRVHCLGNVMKPSIFKVALQAFAYLPRIASHTKDPSMSHVYR